ncbi:complex 1 protein (LYR family) domain-containing protein [Ditylenchus destructor]|nr:complex 1 protein (LYR family) domain-containing protein [Ditylenchus destructor]
MSRQRVLSTYRRILRLGNNWTAQNPEDTLKEREYIKEEARKQFKAHSQESNPETINKLLGDTDKRIEVSCHYGIPYERPPYLHPSASYDVNTKSKTFKIRPHKGPNISQQRKYSCLSA